MNKFFALSIISIVFLFNACELNKVEDEPLDKGNFVQITLPNGGQSLIESSNDFCLDVFKEIFSNSEKVENIFISPLSLSMALSMTCNGASGNTLDSIIYALRLSDLSLDEINAVNKTLTNKLPSVDEKVDLGIANSIWYREDFQVLNDFINVNETNYNAEVEELDFNDPNVKDIINGWVEVQTNGKIKDLIKKVEPVNVMFLINALYFNADWTIAFNEDETSGSTFRLDNGNTTEVDMMKMKDTIAYYTNDNFSAIELEYGQGNFTMLVMLPSGQQNVSRFLENMDYNQLDECITGLTKREVHVQLPKFRFGYEIELNQVLTNMGMGIAFGSFADFSKINGTGGLYIDYVLQKSFIDVSEKGTEAAAATVVAVSELSAIGGSSDIWFTADKPFVFFIREKSTGAILFTGLISEPTMEE